VEYEIDYDIDQAKQRGHAASSATRHHNARPAAPPANSIQWALRTHRSKPSDSCAGACGARGDNGWERNERPEISKSAATRSRDAASRFGDLASGSGVARKQHKSTTQKPNAVLLRQRDRCTSQTDV